jgi:signal transduction histidine kinase
MRADGNGVPVELGGVSDSPSTTDLLRAAWGRTAYERRLTEIRLSGEKQLLEMVALGRALPDILTALCCFVEQHASTQSRCGVYRVDYSGRRLHTFAAPNLPAGFNEGVCALPVDRVTGPCARATSLKAQVITADIGTDPDFEGSPLRQLALAHDLRSCWTTAIVSCGAQLLGTVLIFPGRPAYPSSSDLDLMRNVTHIAAIAIEDVARRRNVEEDLGKVRSELARVASVTSLGALTASIVHEVNQPLSGIMTNASACLRMLSAEILDIEGARETARRTMRDGRRAAEVIARLRALFSRKEVKSEWVDLNDAAREIVALSSSELQRNRVILRCELAEDLPQVSGDRVQLQQVILNLLLNAADAMTGVADDSRHVILRTERDGADRARLSVIDAGVGLEAQVVARLFEPFYTTKDHGMGIGLFVSRSIIENHHGDLRVTANEGPGATFSFSLPGRHPDIGAANSLIESSDKVVLRPPLYVERPSSTWPAPHPSVSTQPTS